MYTTRSALAYDAMAASLSCGDNVGTMSVEWLWREIHELGAPQYAKKTASHRMPCIIYG